MKKNFISDLLIPFFSGLGPQKASGAIFPFFSSISAFFTVSVAAKAAKCIPIHPVH